MSVSHGIAGRLSVREPEFRYWLLTQGHRRQITRPLGTMMLFEFIPRPVQNKVTDEALSSMLPPQPWIKLPRSWRLLFWNHLFQCKEGKPALLQCFASESGWTGQVYPLQYSLETFRLCHRAVAQLESHALSKPRLDGRSDGGSRDSHNKARDPLAFERCLAEQSWCHKTFFNLIWVPGQKDSTISSKCQHVHNFANNFRMLKLYKKILFWFGVNCKLNKNELRCISMNI